MITDDQVFAALEAAQDEFACWRMVPMGDVGSRIIREPQIPPFNDPGAETGTITMIPISETGKDAKKTFDNFRSCAGMRAALESLKC